MSGALVVLFLINTFGYITVNGLAMMPTDPESYNLNEVMKIIVKLHDPRSLLEAKELIEKLLHSHGTNQVADSLRSNLNMASRGNSANSVDAGMKHIETQLDSSYPQVINIPGGNGNGTPLRAMTTPSSSISSTQSTLPIAQSTGNMAATVDGEKTPRRRRKNRRPRNQSSTGTFLPSTLPVASTLSDTTRLSQTQTMQSGFSNIVGSQSASRMGAQPYANTISSRDQSIATSDATAHGMRSEYLSDLQNPDMLHHDRNGLPLVQAALPLGQLSVANGVVNGGDQFNTRDMQYDIHNARNGLNQVGSGSSSSYNLDATQSLERQYSRTGYTGTSVTYDTTRNPGQIIQNSRVPHTGTTGTGTYPSSNNYPSNSYLPTTATYTPTDSISRPPNPALDSRGNTVFSNVGQNIGQQLTPRNTQFNGVQPSGQVQSTTPRNPNTQFNVAQPLSQVQALPLAPTTPPANSLVQQLTTASSTVPLVFNLPPSTALPYQVGRTIATGGKQFRPVGIFGSFQN